MLFLPAEMIFFEHFSETKFLRHKKIPTTFLD
jgi:hypothetical protein